MTDNLTDQLKNKTVEKHQRVEKSLLLLLKSMESTADYLQILHIFYSYFGGLEQSIDPFINEQVVDDYHYRRKSSAIADDILSLHGSFPEKMGAGLLPEISNPWQALGAMYVMEGSTLGGTHIAAMIAKRIPYLSSHLRFFKGYGSETQTMWEKFKMNLNRYSADPEKWPMVINAADETFEKMNHCIQLNTQPR